MVIEVGKSYLNRIGESIKIMSVFKRKDADINKSIYFDTHFNRYDMDGNCLSEYREHSKFNLVNEI